MPKNQADDDLHKQFYKKAIHSYGVADVRSLYWNSDQSQEGRFLSLKRVGNLKNSSILDLGCGRGDFLDYLYKINQVPKRYMGVDLMKEFIHFAKLRHPKALFMEGNFFSLKLKKSFDYIVCNGALNFKKENNLLFVKEFIEFFLPYANKSMGITLLKEAEGYIKNPYIYSYKPQDVYKLLKSMYISFNLFEDYSDNDMTIIIKKSV